MPRVTVGGEGGVGALEYVCACVRRLKAHGPPVSLQPARLHHEAYPLQGKSESECVISVVSQ